MSITTKFWTRAEIIAKIQRDLDLEDEFFVTPDEMYGYIEEAIDETEKMVHRLYEDYFLATAPLPVTAGTSDYPLPDTIFAQKVRGIFSGQGTSSAYEVKRLQDGKKLRWFAEDLTTATQLSYFIVNSAIGGAQIRLVPMPITDETLDVWFLRQANRLDDDLDQLDIPEASQYIIQYVKVRCYEKEGHPNLAKALTDQERLRENLSTILAGMVADGENKIEMDLTVYEEMN